MIDYYAIEYFTESDAESNIPHFPTIYIMTAEGENIKEEEEKTAENDNISGCLNFSPEQGGVTGKLYKK